MRDASSRTFASYVMRLLYSDGRMLVLSASLPPPTQPPPSLYFLWLYARTCVLSLVLVVVNSSPPPCLLGVCTMAVRLHA